ncbi:hypothetical protein MRX96_042826 [Rhipicephalus microplus]
MTRSAGEWGNPIPLCGPLGISVLLRRREVKNAVPLRRKRHVPETTRLAQWENSRQDKKKKNGRLKLDPFREERGPALRHTTKPPRFRQNRGPGLFRPRAPFATFRR